MTSRDLEAAIVDLEVRLPGRGPAKNEAIRRTLALSPARYYQVLHRLGRSPEWAAREPLLVARISRLATPRPR